MRFAMTAFYSLCMAILLSDSLHAQRPPQAPDGRASQAPTAPRARALQAPRPPQAPTVPTSLMALADDVPRERTLKVAGSSSTCAGDVCDCTNCTCPSCPGLKGTLVSTTSTTPATSATPPIVAAERFLTPAPSSTLLAAPVYTSVPRALAPVLHLGTLGAGMPLQALGGPAGAVCGPGGCGPAGLVSMGASGPVGPAMGMVGLGGACGPMGCGPTMGYGPMSMASLGGMGGMGGCGPMGCGPTMGGMGGFGGGFGMGFAGGCAGGGCR